MIKKIMGFVPMSADVLMIGLKPNEFDYYQRMVKGGFQSQHMGWMYVANSAKTFEYAAFNFIPRRPDLDIIFITNDVKRSEEELQAGATLLAASIVEQEYEIKPYVKLNSKTDFLQPIFEAVGIVAACWSIEEMAGERHRKKCELADERPEEQIA